MSLYILHFSLGGSNSLCVLVFRRIIQVVPREWHSCASHITKLKSSVAVEPWTELAADAISLKFVVVFTGVLISP